MTKYIFLEKATDAEIGELYIQMNSGRYNLELSKRTVLVLNTASQTYGLSVNP